MKKSLFLFGALLTAGIANAQYQGRVGVNTETPSATLNVKSKTGTTSATKNLELENAAGTKMVTVLDDGRVGVNTTTPTAQLHVMGDIKSTHSSNEGGRIFLENPTKNAVGEITRWTIFNMTDKNTGSKYIPGLHFWAYQDGPTFSNKSSQMVITDGGRVGIGIGSTPSGAPTQQLDVKETARLRGLSGTGDRVVVAAADGTLKVGTAASTGGVNTDPTMVCNATNAGKMNFGEVTIGGKKSEAFGFCMKNSDGTYKWFYITGGANTTGGGTGQFGTGL